MTTAQPTDAQETSYIKPDGTVATHEEEQLAYNEMWEFSLKQAGIIAETDTFSSPLPANADQHE